jgi:hypothetical protein
MKEIKLLYDKLEEDNKNYKKYSSDINQQYI